MKPRYILTRLIADRAVAKRYQRKGWMAFDTKHEQHGTLQPTRDQAINDVAALNAYEQCQRSTFPRPCRLAAGHAGACQLVDRE